MEFANCTIFTALSGCAAANSPDCSVLSEGQIMAEATKSTVESTRALSATADDQVRKSRELLAKNALGDLLEPA